ncbi:hypothetical protein ES703_52551 [subsurface metagenome]
MSQQDGIRAILENETTSDRFRMPILFQIITSALQGTKVARQYAAISSILGHRVSTYVLKSVLRFAFLIELVKTPKIETTKFEVRWASRLEQTDPRYASYEECFHVLETIVAILEEKVHGEDQRELLRSFESRHLLPYEIPLDYKERESVVHIHRPVNVIWIGDDLVEKAVKLRSFLLSEESNPYSRLFALAYGKIKVKTYLTDRVLTGPHKTNREKRWETHPASVHFALRRTCLEIEVALINQLCHFQDFPTDLKRRLTDAGILSFSDELFRCPITMEPLSFAEFEREIRDPIHGKASFQVGHPNPLKSLSDDPHSGHNAQNISWISSEGNRIQGSLSLQDTRALIQRIYRNYERFGVL